MPIQRNTMRSSDRQSARQRQQAAGKSRRRQRSGSVVHPVRAPVGQQPHFALSTSIRARLTSASAADSIDSIHARGARCQSNDSSSRQGPDGKASCAGQRGEERCKPRPRSRGSSGGGIASITSACMRRSRDDDGVAAWSSMPMAGRRPKAKQQVRQAAVKDEGSPQARRMSHALYVPVRVLTKICIDMATDVCYSTRGHTTVGQPLLPKAKQRPTQASFLRNCTVSAVG